MELGNMLKRGVMAICAILVLGIGFLCFTSYGSSIYNVGSNLAPRFLDVNQNNPLAATTAVVEVQNKTLAPSAAMKTGQRLSYLNKKVKDVCSKNIALQKIVRKTFIVKDEKRKLLFFPIPKIGSSFMKRVFKAMHAESRNVSLFDISNNNAHSGKDIYQKWIEKKDHSIISALSSRLTSFVFVRDPFSRLFSGYVDKIMIPNSLGEGHTRAFYHRYPGRGKSSGGSLTFPDFAMYVADAILQNKMEDGHFYPMWYFCNPCSVNLTFVAKMEHFMEDTKYILSSVGVDINKVAKTQDDDKLKENDERGIIADLIIYIFRHSRINQLNPDRIRFILQRIWTVYKIRGYISKTAQMPTITNPNKITETEFVKMALDRYDLDVISTPKEVKKAQRTESMMEAYSRVPLPILKKLAKAFETDCKLYDYSCDVVDRFERFKPNYSGKKSYYFT